MSIHRVRTSDTVTTLAARYLDDASRWREIVTANELRFPYISDDPLAQYGPRLAAYALGDVATIGQRLIALPGADVALVRAGVRVVLIHRDETGALFVDTHLADAFNGNSLTLRDPLTANYPAGTTVAIYAPPGEVAGRVARPGDMLIIPDGAEQTADSTITSDNRFGRDLACDANGYLQGTSSGDLAVVDGSANLVQQLRHRLQTPRGELIRHPLYGCDMHNYVGQAAAPTLAILIQAAVAQALVDDPRVARVEGVSVRQRGDQIEALVNVEARNERIALTVEVGTL